MPMIMGDRRRTNKLIALSFTLVFMYAISSVYAANIIYYILLLKEILKKGTIVIKKNKLANWFYLAFIIWATISTFIFIIEYSNISTRNIIQYLFTLQYFVLIINIKFKVDKFELWIYRFSIMLSLTIIVLYAYFVNIAPSVRDDDLWAVKFIPGWPNSVPIPLLMGLWLSFRKRSHIFIKLLIFMALFLTTSRIGLLGGLIVFGYFLLKKAQKNKLWIGVLVLLGVVLSYILVIDPLLIKRLSSSWDRIDIFWTTMEYVKHRPVWGFGGNTIDQLIGFYGDSGALKNWGHTHNWLLEMLIRYGIGGAILFTGFIVAIFTRIRNKDKKFMFLLLILSALFQTYIRDFVFLFYLIYLSTETTEEKEVKKGITV